VPDKRDFWKLGIGKKPVSEIPGGLNGSVQHLLLSERRYALCRGRSRSHPMTAGTQNTALNGLLRGSTPSISPIDQKTRPLKKTI